MPPATRGRTAGAAVTPRTQPTAALAPHPRSPAEGRGPRAGTNGTSRPGTDLATTVGRTVAMPLLAVTAVADDIAATARRPEAVLYWGGLAVLAALGVLEWPAAAAVGVGIAVARGSRREGAARPAT
jgi:hypothetical protein